MTKTQAIATATKDQAKSVPPRRPCRKGSGRQRRRPASSRLDGPDPFPQPVLRFSPTAWAKLLYFRDRRDCEIGGFAITPAADLLYIDQFITVRQEVTAASVCFDDGAVADFFDAQVDAGRRPEQFARTWIHTHPGNSPNPSHTDEETFHRVFGSCEWAVMFIVGRTGKTYARLRFNVGPGGQLAIPVDMDYALPFGPSDHEAWQAEYDANIKPGRWHGTHGSQADLGLEDDLSCYCFPDDWQDELDGMEPAEQQAISAELGGLPDPRDESEVFDESD